MTNWAEERSDRLRDFFELGRDAQLIEPNATKFELRPEKIDCAISLKLTKTPQ